MRSNLVENIVSKVNEKKRSITAMSPMGNVRGAVDKMDAPRLRRLHTEMIKTIQTDISREDESILSDPHMLEGLKSVKSSKMMRQSIKDGLDKVKVKKVRSQLEYMIKDLIVKENKRLSTPIDLKLEFNEAIEPLELGPSSGESQ